MSKDHLFEADCIAAEQELDRLYASNKELLAALEHLVDEQNGPPLEHPRKKAEWEAAMARARVAIQRAKEAK